MRKRDEKNEVGRVKGCREREREGVKTKKEEMNR